MPFSPQSIEHMESRINTTRLQAAAPDLLAALYDVMQCFVGDDENEVAQAARAAIAKATGE